MSRPSKAALIGLVTVVIALAALLYLRVRFAVPIGNLKSPPMLDTEPEWLPKEPPPIKFTAQSMSTAERQEFLNADYRIVRKVADLPAGIRKLYTPKGESRVAIADLGEKFQETDVITSPDLPWRRLIFAGVAQDRAFIHYEKSGIGHAYIIEFFRLESPDIAVGLWSGYRGPARDIEELKELVLEEDHDSCECEVKWQSVDQLCGQVELSTPTKKIIVVNGRKETRLYATHVDNAEVTLYRATMRDKACCGTAAPMARAHSGRFGGFEFSGVQEGLYWLRGNKRQFRRSNSAAFNYRL
jgi:hypothetical protein